jgi:hypothetical protein
MIGEFIAHDSRPPVWEFESQASGHAQCFGPASALSRWGERQPVAPLAESIKMTHRGSFLRIRFRRHHSLFGLRGKFRHPFGALFLRPIRKGPHELVVAEGPQVG